MFEPLGIQTQTHYYVTEKSYKNICISSLHLTFNICIQGIKNTHVKRPLYNPLYKIYYKNMHNILLVFLQRFSPNYNNGTAHNHNLRHQALRLPMTRKEYYVQSTKYQLLKLIRETRQLELDRCLTSSLIQFVAYFKYKIIVCAIQETATFANKITAIPYTYYSRLVV